MRNIVVIASAIAALAAPLAVHAKDAKKAAPAPAPAASAQPNEAEVKRGVIIIRSFVSALDSDKIDNERKGRYVACLYNNPVKNISTAAGKIIAGNPKLDGENPTHVFLAASAACKALPAENAQAPATGTPPSGKKPEGR